MLTYYKKYIKRQLLAAKNISNRKNVHFSLKKICSQILRDFFRIQSIMLSSVFFGNFSAYVLHFGHFKNVHFQKIHQLYFLKKKSIFLKIL